MRIKGFFLAQKGGARGFAAGKKKWQQTKNSG